MKYAILADTGLTGIGTTALAMGVMIIYEDGKITEGLILAGIGSAVLLLKYLLRHHGAKKAK